MNMNEINRSATLLTTMPLPMVLNEIMLMLLVATGGLNKCLDFIQVSCWLYTATIIVNEELQV
jgi:hypothetical protein